MFTQLARWICTYKMGVWHVCVRSAEVARTRAPQAGKVPWSRIAYWIRTPKIDCLLCGLIKDVCWSRVFMRLGMLYRWVMMISSSISSFSSSSSGGCLAASAAMAGSSAIAFSLRAWNRIFSYIITVFHLIVCFGLFVHFATSTSNWSRLWMGHAYLSLV